MGRRKYRTKYVDGEKENITKEFDEQHENCSEKMENNCNVVKDLVVADTKKNIDLSVQGTESMEDQTNECIFSDVSNKNKDSNSFLEDTSTTMDVLTSSRMTRGKKRPIEELSDSMLIDKKGTKSINFKKKCVEVENKVQVLEGTCMPCPEHWVTVQNMFHNILQGCDNNDNVLLNNNDQIANAMNILNIDPIILFTLKKDNPTSTARSILKHLYPDPAINFKLSNIDKALASAIVVYAKASHPNDSSKTSKIRHAMSNYFALLTYKKKIKSMMSNTKIQKQ